ncbi:MAG: hypothetical protein AAB647_00410 [Patescibacteria group bacterium]
MEPRKKAAIYTRMVLVELGQLVNEMTYGGVAFRQLRWASRREFWAEMSHLQQILWRLERQGAIRRTGRGQSATIYVTEIGKRQIRRLLTELKQAPRQQVWDGKWRIISFDVSESHRTGRQLLQRKLRQLGCYPLQRSVYIYPFEIKDLIEEIRMAYDLRTDLVYLIAESIDNPHLIQSFFENNGVLTLPQGDDRS